LREWRNGETVEPRTEKERANEKTISRIFVLIALFPHEMKLDSKHRIKSLGLKIADFLIGYIYIYISILPLNSCQDIYNKRFQTKWSMI